MVSKKIILITGCSSGIGYYTALTFARNDYIVFASLRNVASEGAKQLKEIAEKESLDLHVITLDVTSESSIKKAVASVKEKAGRIDIIVNNAGVMHLGPVETFTIDEVKEQFETNFFGHLRMIQAVTSLMREQKSGLIINVSSINGLLSFPLYGIYSSSKFALETMTEVLRFELAPFGIKVALVEPGTFTTKFWSNRKHAIHMKGKDSPYEKLVSFFDKVDKKNNSKRPAFLDRLIHPQRVADTIYRIAQEENPGLRHIVGYDARLFYTLGKILPERLRNWALRRVYQW